MSTVRCRPDGFISLRHAKRAAWQHSNGSGKTVQPVHCADCGRWHLAATPTADTSTT